MSIHTEILKDIEFAASFSPCHNFTSIATQTSLLKFKSTVKNKRAVFALKYLQIKIKFLCQNSMHS